MRGEKFVAVCLSLSFLGFFSVGALGQRSIENVPIPVRVALGYRRFSEYRSVSFSPNGKWLAYAVRENEKNVEVGPDYYYATGLMHYAAGARIFLRDLGSSQVEEIPATGNCWLPAWSPDSRYLAFLSDQAEDHQAHLWLWDTTRHQIRLAADRPVRGDRLQWLPDGHHILLTVVPEGLTVEDYVKKVVQNERTADPSTAIDVENGSNVEIFRAVKKSQVSDGTDAIPWNLERYLRDLVLLDTSTGMAETVAHGKRISGFYLSPDGKSVAYTVPTGFERAGSQQILFDLWTARLDSSETKKLITAARLDLGGADFSWSPDSLKIAVQDGSNAENLFSCKVVDVVTGNTVPVSSLAGPVPNFEARRPLWLGVGDLYFIIQDSLWTANLTDKKAKRVATIPDSKLKWMIWQGENTLWTTDRGASTVVLAHNMKTAGDGFYKLDLRTGDAAQVGMKDKCLACTIKQPPMLLNADASGVAFWPEDTGQYPDMWLTSFSSSDRRLTVLNPEQEKYPTGEMRILQWRGLDGQVLSGALLLPPSYQPGHTVPLIVWIYGGQSTANYFHRFGFVGTGVYDMRLLASRGYAVFLPDAPQESNSPMADLAKVVLPGVNKAIEMGIVDPQRLGIMGQSYGSYSTLSIIVQTPRFAAAIAIDGTSNLFSSYSEMDDSGAAYGIAQAEYGQELMGGTPWQVPHKYLENSPFFYFDRLETPLLVAHGRDDTAVAPFLGDEIFVALRRLGKEVVYARYRHQGHDPGYWNYADQVDLSNRILRWFDDHLKGEIKETSTSGEY